MLLKDVLNTYLEKLWPYADYELPKSGTPERILEEKDTEKHLLHLQHHCKECHKRDVIKDIWDDLRFFVKIRNDCKPRGREKTFKIRPQRDRTLRSKPFVIAYSLYSILKGRRGEPDFYKNVRMNVYFMFMAMDKVALFDWHWLPMELAPKRENISEDHIFVEGLYRDIATRYLKRTEMTFVHGREGDNGSLKGHGTWVEQFTVDEKGGSSYRCIAEPLGWHMLSEKRQQALQKVIKPQRANE